MIADHQECKLKLLRIRTWNKLFLAIALSFVLNPMKGTEGGNFIFAQRSDYIQLLLVKCLESYALSFSLRALDIIVCAGRHAIPQEGIRESDADKAGGRNRALLFFGKDEEEYIAYVHLLCGSFLPRLPCISQACAVQGRAGPTRVDGCEESEPEHEQQGRRWISIDQLFLKYLIPVKMLCFCACEVGEAKMRNGI